LVGEFASLYFLPIFALYGLVLANFSNGLSTLGKGTFDMPVSYSLFNRIRFFIWSGARFSMLGFTL